MVPFPFNFNDAGTKLFSFGISFNILHDFYKFPELYTRVIL